MYIVNINFQKLCLIVNRQITRLRQFYSLQIIAEE